MGKITRVRTGCWTCKRRHRKCDEAKPQCNNCVTTNRTCEGYGIRLSFDVDDSRNRDRFDNKGVFKHSFIGRPRAKKKTDSSKELNGTGSFQNQNTIQSEGPKSATHGTSQFLVSKGKGDIYSHTPTEVSQSSTDNVENPFSASSIEMEEQPKIGINNHPGTNFELFGTELFEGLEYLLKSPAAQSATVDSTRRKNSQSLNFILDSPSIGINAHDFKIREENDKPKKTDSPLFSLPRGSSASLMSEALTSSSSEDTPHSSYSGTQVFDRNYPVNNSTTTEDSSLTYSEENMMLKHFFKNLLPLLDAHPNTPWPDLALKYCDFDIARSCFISLSCIHIYESRKGGQEYYKKGMAHINRTMDYLIQFISSNDSQDDIHEGNSTGAEFEIEQEKDINADVGNILMSIPDANDISKTENIVTANTRKKLISSFVILVLINVHILFAVLEKGLSSFSRFFFKVFASVCQDKMFYESLKENAKKQSLVVILSWYDTVSAIVSADCRLPYCNPEWYGSSVSNSGKVSTAKMMGCPGEIFKAMSKVCSLRHELHKGTQMKKEELKVNYSAIENEILRYREYVSFEQSYDEDEMVDTEGQAFPIRLKAAQCWSLAVYITLIRTVKFPFYEKRIKSLLHEFIDVYGSMKPTLPFVTQMVWPVFAMGCECTTSWEKSKLELFMDTLYRNAQMGTLFTLRQIVFRVWETEESPEQIIKAYLDESIDYLPL
ncbi:hypothetical protein CLIB1423_04S04940 [[Candida] railenensis]|uniref:Zn(2)-C6 fungal-type domain-containing protein n=1 Tax=[Candida] railenensis TaxID=45579 RepID=A0A9P0QNE5_9ASCO|nr:hypothetical protein CLIB1423_04S04940 [[Candida] railenensis]